jgi:spermidine/putrescine transport system permease protein
MKKLTLSRKVFSYPYILFMLLFVVTPLVLILVNAFIVDGKIDFSNFVDYFGNPANMNVLTLSIEVGVITTLLCLLIGYPTAYLLSKMNAGKLLVLIFIMPMWVNFLLRTLATKTIFEALGVQLGIGTVITGMVYNYLPMMILPLHTTISGIDKSYIEAAGDLGASPLRVFTRVVVPMSMTGIISGITMVFIPTISTFAISQLLSNSSIYLFGDSIQLKFDQGMYGVGSVMSIVMLVLVLLSNFIINKVSGRDNQNRSTLL